MAIESEFNIYLHRGREKKIDFGYVAYRGFRAVDGAPCAGAKYPFFTLSSEDVDISGFGRVQSGIMAHLGVESQENMRFPVNFRQSPKDLVEFIGEAAAMLNTGRSGFDHEGPILVYVLDGNWKPVADLLDAYIRQLRDRCCPPKSA